MCVCVRVSCKNVTELVVKVMSLEVGRNFSWISPVTNLTTPVLATKDCECYEISRSNYVTERERGRLTRRLTKVPHLTKED